MYRRSWDILGYYRSWPPWEWLNGDLPTILIIFVKDSRTSTTFTLYLINIFPCESDCNELFHQPSTKGILSRSKEVFCHWYFFFSSLLPQPFILPPSKDYTWGRHRFFEIFYSAPFKLKRARRDENMQMKIQISAADGGFHGKQKFFK